MTLLDTLLFAFVAAFALVFLLWGLYQALRRVDAGAIAPADEQAEQVIDEERRHSLAAGDISGCPRPVDRDGRDIYGGWYHQPKVAAERRRRMQVDDELMRRWQALIKEAKSEDES